MFFIISWKMTLFTIAIMMPAMCVGPVYGRTMKRLMKEISDGKAASSAIAEEAFSNIRTVKAFATEDKECLDYQVKNDFVFGKAREQALCYGVFNFVMQFIMFGSLDALVYFAAYLNQEGTLTIG
jgi:ABC-type bacteriocin/lantibiotic exporter with double-glycine peptidase domain